MELININRLRAFYIACKCGNMKEAGRVYGYSRSTLSKDIMYLEEFYKVNLFVRKKEGGHVRVNKLTREGEILFQECEKAFNTFEKIQNFKFSFDNSDIEILTIMTTHGLSQYWLKKYITNFLQTFPKQVLRLINHTNFSFEKDLIDIYIGAYLDSHEDVIQNEIFSIEFGLFAHKNITLNKTKELQEYKILYNSKFEIDQLLSLCDFIPRPENLVQINCTETIIELIESGFGIGILPININIDVFKNKKRILSKEVHFIDKVFYTIQKKNKNFSKYYTLFNFIKAQK